MKRKRKPASSTKTSYPKPQTARVFPAALVPLVLFLAVVVIYLPSIGNDFLYDDYEVILSNDPVESVGDLAQIFSERHFPSLPYYRPVVRSTLLLQRAVHGDRAGPFHLFNVLLMAFAALLSYSLLRLPIFQLQRWPALCAAAIFALHPIASSCVYPIASGRETLLPAVFALASVYCFLRPGLRWRALAATSFALALFSKEQAVVILGFFVLADGLGLTATPATKSIRGWVWRYWPEVCILTTYLGIRYLLFGGQEYQLGDLGKSMLSFVYALQVIAVPFVELVYEPPVEVWLSWWRLAAVVGLLIFWRRCLVGMLPERRVLTWFWFGWFVATLLPTANLLDQEAHFAERYVFLATLAPLALIASTLSSRTYGGYASKLVTGLSLVIVCTLAAVSVHRAGYFRNNDAFTKQWLKTNPEALNAHISLGAVLVTEGNLGQAEYHFREALRIAPGTAATYNNLAGLMLHQRKFEKAKALLQQALLVDPNSAETHNNLGAVLRRVGKTEEAIAHFSQAIRLNPNDAEAQANLANVLAEVGKIQKSIRHYQEALQLKPGWPPVANRLAWLLATQTEPQLRSGVEAVRLAEQFCRDTGHSEPLFLDTLAAAYAETGRYEEALQTAGKALKLAEAARQLVLAAQIRERMDVYRNRRPARYGEVQWRTTATADTYSELAGLMLQQGKLAQAQALLEQALEADPQSAETHNNLGTVFLRMGKTEKAIAHFSRAVSLNADDAQAHANLANALAEVGMMQESIRHYREALRINPGWPSVANRLAWLLATQTEARLRSGVEAVRLAERFCRDTAYSEPLFLDTLAAAYAETGRYEEALDTAGKALELADQARQSELAAQIKERMEAFRLRRPLRYAEVQWRSSPRVVPNPPGL